MVPVYDVHLDSLARHPSLSLMAEVSQQQWPVALPKVPDHPL
jgi:hypothetical protein